MSALDAWLPEFDVRERHVPPERALELALACPVAFANPRPGTVRIVADVRAEARPGGSLLSTETRVAAVDERSRRAFRRYWLLIGPFSKLIRRRWLAAAARRAAAE